jgi:hypothetical protein
MALNKETILSRTHYGLQIFSWILRCYDENATLSLRGRDCLPVINPLEPNSTILISINDNLGKYHDLNNPAIAGDVFDFANQHFSLNDQELLLKINEVLNLKLVPTEEPENTIKRVQHIPMVSYFKAPISNIIPNKDLSLKDVYHLINSDTYKQRTFTLQNLSDSKTAKTYKAQNFDYVTFSGTFSKRSDKYLTKHSGLLTIDFDNLIDPYEIKEKLLYDEYFETELIFISPTGNGLKWVIPINLKKDTHLNYFLAISNYIQQSYKIKVDQSGKDTSRACFLPHDPNIYINPKHLSI